MTEAQKRHLPRRARPGHRSSPGMLAACAALALFHPGATRAQDTVVRTTNYYVVKGATLREVQQSIRQSRPWKDRHPAEGFTQWQVSWQYTVSGGPDGCRCASFRTKTVVTITLPRWVPAAPPPTELKTAWQRYLEALARHEAGHAQFAVSAASELRRKIESLGADPNCENLKRRIDGTGRQVLADYRKQEKAYDERTGHGTKEGVSLFGHRPER